MEEEKQTPTPAEETEVIKALKEAYEEKITQLEKKLADTQTEHAKQIREILKSGTQNEAPVAETEQERTEEEQMCDRILAKIKKKRGL